MALVGAQQVDDDDFVPTYARGDQRMTLDLGAQIPLAFTGGADGAASTQLSLGALGRLSWGAFLSNDATVGVAIQGSFAFSPNRNALFMIPITGFGTWTFRAHPLEFPVSLELGVNASRYGDLLKWDPVVAPSVGAYWNYSTEWAFGATVRYFLVPQWYGGPEPAATESRVGHFLTTSLGVLYRF